MREILFRGKSTDTKEWVIGNHLKMKFGGEDIDCIVPYGALVDILLGNTVGRVDTETLGQFTGLTDKNGVKIFEGDVVKCTDGDNYPVIFEQRNNTACFGLAITPDNTWVLEGPANFIVEVIGNVHDNPELLKGE